MADDNQSKLFENRAKRKRQKDPLAAALDRHDRDSFYERLERLRYIGKVFPRGIAFAGDLETVLIFDEAKMAFVNGELVSTILLCQAFVERRLQLYFEGIGERTIGKRGLKQMVDFLRKHSLLSEFFIDKIDALRCKRNPFVHLKELDHEFNLDKRLMQSIRENHTELLYELLLEDAKEAISLMYTIVVRMPAVMIR